MGKLPTLSIQKTDGCQVYLSEVRVFFCNFSKHCMKTKRAHCDILTLFLWFSGKWICGQDLLNYPFVQVAKAAEIVTSKSSEMNILIPDASGEFIEYPVPEQFKTVFKDGKLQTTISDIC